MRIMHSSYSYAIDDLTHTKLRNSLSKVISALPVVFCKHGTLNSKLKDAAYDVVATIAVKQLPIKILALGEGGYNNLLAKK